MRFAKVVFWIAGIWGIVVVTPLYFLFTILSRQYPPAITHPEFYYGFVGVALAWQIAFLLIATDPARFRPIMIAGVLEKLGYSTAVIVLYLQGRAAGTNLIFAGADLLLCILFLIALAKTRITA
jgi:hypothetical protein